MPTPPNRNPNQPLNPSQPFNPNDPRRPSAPGHPSQAVPHRGTARAVPNRNLKPLRSVANRPGGSGRPSAQRFGTTTHPTNIHHTYDVSTTACADRLEALLNRHGRRGVMPPTAAETQRLEAGVGDEVVYLRSLGRNPADPFPTAPRAP